MLLMVIGNFVYPDANCNELAAFIVRNGGGVYSRQDILSRLREIDIVRKKCSTEAYDAFLPVNIEKCQDFFQQPPPLGVVGLQRRQLMDFDEAAMSLETVRTKYGYMHKLVQCRRIGHYVKGRKLTLMIAIKPGDPTIPPHRDGSIENPSRWFRVSYVSGTTTYRFADFLTEVNTSLDNHPADGDLDKNRVYMWDNLQSHLNPLIYNVVEHWPGNGMKQIVLRPPYQPKFGPTEYVFCQLAAKVQTMVRPDWTHKNLRLALMQLLANIGRGGAFDRTFAHCGY